MEHKLGLVLTGGGARAAYQVGVLKAIAEFMPRYAHNPFPVICGTSAGALNAATLAVNARDFRKGIKYLVNMWKSFQVEDVYRTDVIGVFANTLRWLAGLLLSGFGINRLKRVSLLDNTPLAEFLDEILPCDRIQDSIDAGVLHALSITASGYGSGQSVTFYQGVPGIQPWVRARRIGVATRIENKHLLASSAIPFLFPAVHINREYFGDGSMRQIAPISSALHLGATRVLVISVGPNGDEELGRSKIGDYPSLAQIAGHALNSIFLDTMEVDLERIRRTNHTLGMMPEEARKKLGLHHIDVMIISPSQSIEKIAERHTRYLPWTIRLLLRLAGVMHGSGANLVAYLLSEKRFCRALIDMGYRDALARKEEIMAFLEAPAVDGAEPV
ncbi:MAG: patatin-like phospholipase family protein [Sideroxydans sp.]|nr:patatin-like phospholipase family protein [Sideroxydans sp.]